MKTSIERAALLKSLSHVQSVVERRNTIPILSNVLVEARERELKLTATDLDMEIVESLPADVIGAGGTTAPAHMLHEIVRKLPDGAQVQLDGGEGDGRLTLKSGRSRFALSCLPREDFPTLTAGELPHRFALAPADLVRLIERTRFAISTEETRYYLNGIYLHTTEAGGGKKMLRAVSTDGHRLARVELPLPEGAQGMPGVIVPRKAVIELRRLLDDASEPVEIALSENKIRFGFDAVVLTTKLIDGTFPDYARVIPTGNDKVLRVDAKRFAESVDRVSTVATEKSRAVKLSLSEGRLTLTVVNPESGTAVEEIDADYAAEPIDIGFNARYLMEITAQIESPEVEFVFADSGSPTIVRDPEDSRALFVLMPMRV
jgi:DNA polymerase III subunit beta